MSLKKQFPSEMRLREKIEQSKSRNENKLQALDSLRSKRMFNVTLGINTKCSGFFFIILYLL